MLTREGMHNLVQGIIGGHEARTAGIADLYEEVNTWLKAVDRAHQTMARQLRTDLGRCHVALPRAETPRKAAVKALMDHIAAERAAGRKEWERLGHGMATNRNGAPRGSDTPGAPVRRRGQVAEQEAMSRSVVGAVTGELTALSDRVFVYLANHPDGTRLTEIERELGLGRLQAGRVVRHLMDEGKAEKRDNCYFAI